MNWKIVDLPESYFEKQKSSQIWSFYKNNKFRANLSQVAIGSDDSGEPYVILMRLGDGLITLITQGISFWGTNLAHIKKVDFHGYWAKVNGNDT